MAGISIVAIESRKQAAKRPRPPLPKPASGSCFQKPEQINPLFFEDPFCGVIKKKVRYIVRQRTTDQEFHGKVVNALGILTFVGCLGLNPSLRKDVTHRARDGFKTLASADRGCFQHVVKHEVAFIERILSPAELNRTAPVSFY